jgi:hypothetical protein
LLRQTAAVVAGGTEGPGCVLDLPHLAPGVVALLINASRCFPFGRNRRLLCDGAGTRGSSPSIHPSPSTRCTPSASYSDEIAVCCAMELEPGEMEVSESCLSLRQPRGPALAAGGEPAVHHGLSLSLTLSLSLSLSLSHPPSLSLSLSLSPSLSPSLSLPPPAARTRSGRR